MRNLSYMYDKAATMQYKFFESCSIIFWLFPDILPNFEFSWPISNFPDFLRKIVLPYFFLTCDNPEVVSCHFIFLLALSFQWYFDATILTQGSLAKFGKNSNSESDSSESESTDIGISFELKVLNNKIVWVHGCRFFKNRTARNTQKPALQDPLYSYSCRGVDFFSTVAQD